MIPETEPPVVASPTIAARRREKKWAMAPIAGVKIREVPMPHRMAYVRRKCHNSVALSVH